MRSLAVYLDEVALGALQQGNDYPMQIGDWHNNMGLFLLQLNWRSVEHALGIGAHSGNLLISNIDGTYVINTGELRVKHP